MRQNIILKEIVTTQALAIDTLINMESCLMNRNCHYSPLLKKHATKNYFVGNSDNTSISPRYINKHGVVSHEQKLSLFPTLEKACDKTLFCRK